MLDTGDGGNKMGKWGATSYFIGNIVGSGIFITPASVLRHSSSVGISLAIWALSSIISALGAFCYLELGTSIPRSGNDFAYFTHLHWHPLAFIFLLGCVLTYPLNLAVQAETFGEYLIRAAQLEFCSPTTEAYARKLIGFTLVWSLLFINFFSLRTIVSRFQVAATAAKILSSAIIIICGFYFLVIKGNVDNFRDPFAGSSGWDLASLMTASFSVLYSYEGWDVLNFGVEDLESPERTLPFAIITGISAVTIIFILINLSFFAVLSREQILSSPAVAETLARAVFGHFHYVMPFLVSLLLVGSLNCSLFAASRQLCAASRMRVLPRALGSAHLHSNSPRAALFFHVLLAMVLSNLGGIDELISYAQFSAWAQRCFTMVALLYIRLWRVPVSATAVRVPLVVPLLFLCVCVALVGVNVARNFRTSLLGLVIPTVGALIYLALMSRYSLVQRSAVCKHALNAFNSQLSVYTQLIFNGLAYVDVDEESE